MADHGGARLRSDYGQQNGNRRRDGGPSDHTLDPNTKQELAFSPAVHVPDQNQLQTEPAMSENLG